MPKNIFLESPSPLGYVRVANIVSNNRNRAIGPGLFTPPVYPGRIIGFDILDGNIKQIGSRQFMRRVYYILADDWGNQSDNHLRPLIVPEDGILVKELLSESPWEIKRSGANPYYCRFIKKEKE
jgi:hypothetical protein